MKRVVAAAVALVALAGPAFANSCPKHMAAIDAALAKSPKPSADQMPKVKKFRADGEALHKAGRHVPSEVSLVKAEKILEIQ